MDILDFCFVPFENETLPVREYLEIYKMKQEHCGVKELANTPNMYGVYYDKNSHLNKKGLKIPIVHEPYKGIIEDENSENILISDITTKFPPDFIMYFNKEAYIITKRRNYIKSIK